MGLDTIYLNNINLDKDYFDDDDPEIVIILESWLGVLNKSHARHVEKI